MPVPMISHLLASLLLVALTALPVVGTPEQCYDLRVRIKQAADQYASINNREIAGPETLCAEGYLPAPAQCADGGELRTASDIGDDCHTGPFHVCCSIHAPEGKDLAGLPDSRQARKLPPGVRAHVISRASPSEARNTHGDGMILKSPALTCTLRRVEIQTAMEIAARKNETFFPARPSVEGLVEAGVLKETPVCPNGGFYTIDVSDDEKDEGRRIEVRCSCTP